MPYLMLQAIRELKAENDALEGLVQGLRAEVERLKARQEHSFGEAQHDHAAALTGNAKTDSVGQITQGGKP